jgi:hypothetical protein
MERDKTDDATDSGSAGSGADIVESGGETTAAATGSAERGAATGGANRENVGDARPVGADTMVKVAGEPQSTEER